MNNKILIAVLAVVVIVFGFWQFWGGSVALPSDDSMQEEGMEHDAQTPSSSNTQNTRPAHTFEDGHYVNFIYFDGTSFSPETLTIDSGESVRFVNLSTLSMRIGTRVESLSSPKYASIEQPHVAAEGETYDVFFTEPGTWAYQNLPSAATGIYGTVNVR